MQLAHAHDRLLAKIAVTAAVVALAIAFAGWHIRRRPPYVMVKELVTQGLGKHLGREVQAHGYVQPGTIAHAGGGDHRAVLTDRGTAIRVHVRGDWPKKIRDGTEVVVNGTLVIDRDGWLLESTEMPIRCVGRYEGNEPLDMIYR